MSDLLSSTEVTGVVLAGGLSSRFGSDKALHCIEGESFLVRSVHLLQSLCKEVVVSGNRQEYEELTKVQVLKDIYEGCGPLGGIYTALQTIRTPYALFLTCDMPLMQAEPLAKMFETASGVEVVGWRNSLFPLLVSTTLTQEVERALKEGNYRIKRTLCGREKARMLEIPEGWVPLFVNINRREDLPPSSHTHSSLIT